jgi:hypothetical protein
MLTTLLVAIAGAIGVLAVSWLVSFLGFRKLAAAGRMEQAKQYTSAIGSLTGMVVGFGALVTVIVLVVLVVR